MAIYLCKKIFSYDLKLRHNTSVTDEQTDDVTYTRLIQ